ncbi:hypothetical protein BSQ38_07565 [Pediococcus damnosus]|uniref:restriction endonuclease subunit S n=1 Tax=Pediococcus damnosus TaxID=51663 RepID=UPI000C1CA0F7|nr:restriction endonuclease subunit S [Pediococcus damnosus]PIO81511.1 hypothetical protein BSQ38_07565 [Pediococcus damnosus]
MSDQKQPNVRFAGFDDAWEPRKFFNNIKRTIDFRGRTPKKLGMEWSEKGHLALSALNVKNGYIDKSVNAHYADENLYQKWMTGNELEKGQVLFTTEAPMGNVAQIPDNEKYVLSQRTIAFEVLDNEITNDFLAVILSSKNVFNRLQTLSSGATAKGVSQKSLAQLLITVPNSLKEQTRIGIFFKSLDSLIAANQRQLEQLKTIKKLAMQKIFDQEWRFKGYTDPWELRKLDEVAEFKDNLRIPVTKSDRISGNIPYYGANGIQDYVKGYTHNGEFVLIAEDGANDVMNYPVHYVSGKVWVNNHAHVITGKNEVLDNLYLSSLIKSMNISSWLVGGGRAKLNGEILKKIPINLPTLDEQREIGTFFKGIDRLIAANQSKSEQLKKLKKWFMQNMFI